MRNLKGTIIKATPALNNSYFDQAIIFINEHNEKGATGFVINRIFSRKLNELVEFGHMSAIDIYEGGPVDHDHLFFIHSSPALGGEPIKDGIYFGGDIHMAANQLSNGALSPGQVKIFIGYCGWDKGELEAEIEEGSWSISDEPLTAIFN